MAKIDLGTLVATPGAIEALERASTDLFTLVARHMNGDWGTVPEEDWKLNDEAVTLGHRIVSAYVLPDDTKVWLITEADRSVTTLLLPSEY